MKRELAAILVNDLHLDKNNGELVKYICKQLIQLCKDLDCYKVISSGDVFTNRSGQPLSVLKDFQKIVRLFKKAGIEFITIPGNHDKTDSNSDNSYLDLYNRDICVYSKPCKTTINGVNFFFMPYYGEEVWVEKFRELRESVDESEINYLVTHFAFNGVLNNDGTAVETEFKNKEVQIFTKVLVGHYHNASKVGKNIYYTGSAYQNNYGETVETKGFTLIYNDGNIENVQSEFPKYLKVVLNATDAESIRFAELKYLKEVEDNFVRFLFKGKRVDCEKINTAEFTKRGIEVKFEIDEMTEAVEMSEEDIVISHNKVTITKDFLKFTSEQQIKGKQLKYGLQIIKEFI